MNRYITNGVADMIPLQLQVFLWHLYDDIKLNNQYDYLQVFKIKKINQCHCNLSIIHEQEYPTYTATYQILIDHNLTDIKVYIIENEEYDLMLLGNEY